MIVDGGGEGLVDIRAAITAGAQQISGQSREQVQPPLLYHYTNSTALASIIQESRMWFTNVEFMNDATELKYGYDLVDQKFGILGSDESYKDCVDLFSILQNSYKHIETLGYYIACFSDEEDSLSQWRGYSQDDVGVALGLDCQHLQSDAPAAVELMKVEYGKVRHLELINNVFKQTISVYREFISTDENAKSFLISECARYFRAAILTLVIRFKSAHWSSEREWRMLMAFSRDELKAIAKFRRGKTGIIPYVSASITQFAGVFHGKIPARRIVIGPGPHQQLNKAAFELLLTTQGFDFTDVSCSGVPLR